MRRTFLRAAALTLALAMGPLAPAGAAPYPERPIHVVVPYAGAGTMDIASRILFDRIAKTIGQPVVIENRPGAGGNIGLDAAAKAPPDGYTLVVADPMTSFSANVTLMPTLTFNPLRDFVPVANFGSTGAAIIVTPSLPVATLADFVALAKRRPGELLYASTGVGSPGHLNGEVFARLVGIKAVHVPYRNGGQGTTDLLAGRIHFWIAQIPTRLDQVRAGKLRAIAVAGHQRSPDLPDVPTVREAGFGDFDASSDYAVFAPAGTPQAAIDRLHAEIGAALQDPAVVAKLKAAGLEPKLTDAAAVTRVLQEQIARWADIIKDAHISVTGQ